MEIRVRNVNDALPEALWKLSAGKYAEEATRNGPVLAFPEPVITTYRYPQERMLFCPDRDANPVFHILESLWMLAGRRDVAFLQQFNSKIGQYSDDGKNFNAAYGHRWRSHFGQDQLHIVIRLLRKDPSSRQAVIQMWDTADLTRSTKDKACNTQIVFDVRGGRLGMTVFNRSNDLWWGAYGANAVHFSMLQEFVAAAVGVKMGTYRQVSNNLHLYLDPSVYDGRSILERRSSFEGYDLYASAQVRPASLMANDNYRTFLDECALFCDAPFSSHTYRHAYFNNVARPLAMISHTRRTKSGDGSVWADRITHEDIRRAAHIWIQRRELAKAEK
jgi:hypothetical protein